MLSYNVYREGLLYYFNDLYVILMTVNDYVTDYNIIFRKQIDVISITDTPNIFNDFVYKKSNDKYKSRIIKYNRESMFNCLRNW